MSRPVRAVDIAAGETWRDVLTLCEAYFVYAPIVSVTRGWPTKIEVSGHGIAADTPVPVFIQNVRGIELLNTGVEPYIGERFDDDTLLLRDVNSGSSSAYVPNSGTAKYMPPKDLSVFTPRMQIRKTIGSAVLVEIGSSEITLTANGRITIELSETQTKLLVNGETSPFTCIGHLELVNGAIVDRPFDFEFTVYPEGTEEP